MAIIKLLPALFLVLLLSEASVTAQRFEGEITYQISFVSKVPGLSNDSLQSIMGRSESSYLISTDGYKTTYLLDGKFMNSYTYENTTKRLYHETRQKEYLTWQDITKEELVDVPLEVQTAPTTEVLGKICYPVMNAGPNDSKVTTWYSDEVRINYENYTDHHTGHWNKRLEATNGGIPLKTVTQHKYYTETREAVKIDKRRLTKEELALPSDKLAVASADALDQEAELVSQGKPTMDCYLETREKARSIVAAGNDHTTILIRFVLMANGQIGNYGFVDAGDGPFNDLALEMFKNCLNTFKPGEINGERVDSEVVLPIEF